MRLDERDMEQERSEAGDEAGALAQEIINRLERALSHLPEESPAYGDVAAAADLIDALQTVLRAN
ncbi:hypothetical protein AA103196_1504 [Ameyamaea chiangmaiensis NBRC 103196]|uniref:Uncharacterized protein n=1 Tax=Ameyamaea chiangmaiensis TaxID=442969 RepID=A0A850PFQ0_9PROT|nr:hypothetical protein [Ameyamaea chiangmaiensis]MBS4075325.1 hypothetical protein [Ameyamaea chiangmaiensis]NVN41663.1 hypothetical protein [Ameyamaea chiangmaiensis]GBQ66760.1 hypothetical protein AA103196_1504 [Ameyamaea chiangmaiensis NBRC 103196]